MSDAVSAFLLTLVAGLATGLGGLVAISVRQMSRRFLSASLAFAAGVMVYVSFAEIFFKALEDLEYVWGEQKGYVVTTLVFFGGAGLIALIDRFIPHDDSLTHMMDAAAEKHLRSITTHPAALTGSGLAGVAISQCGTQGAGSITDKRALHRTGVLSAIAIAIHNLPEGLVVFVAAMADPALGVTVAIAIAIHNIPEGIATAAPIYASTGSRFKALAWSVGSGMTEPLGGLIGWMVISTFFTEAVTGISFAAAGGVMVFVAIQHLLPAAWGHGRHRTVVAWFFAGMALMALSLVLLVSSGL